MKSLSHFIIAASAFASLVLFTEMSRAQTDSCRSDIDAGFEIVRQVRSHLFDERSRPEQCAYLRYAIDELLRARSIFVNARCDANTRNENVGLADIMLKTAREADASGC